MCPATRGRVSTAKITVAATSGNRARQNQMEIKMIIEFVAGVLLMGSLFHLSFAIWDVRVLSPIGSSKISNIIYGTFVLLVAVGLYIFQNGVNALFQDMLFLGGLFALGYTILFGLWVNRNRR